LCPVRCCAPSQWPCVCRGAEPPEPPTVRLVADPAWARFLPLRGRCFQLLCRCARLFWGRATLLVGPALPAGPPRPTLLPPHPTCFTDALPRRSPVLSAALPRRITLLHSNHPDSPNHRDSPNCRVLLNRLFA